VIGKVIGYPLPPDYDSPLLVGDRVACRVLRVDGADQFPRQGTVTEVYKSASNPQGSCLVLYAVDWDDVHYEERGYMRHGLVKLAPET
jgi:hypothetical protein